MGDAWLAGCPPTRGQRRRKCVRVPVSRRNPPHLTHERALFCRPPTPPLPSSSHFHSALTTVHKTKRKTKNCGSRPAFDQRKKKKKKSSDRDSMGIFSASWFLFIRVLEMFFHRLDRLSGVRLRPEEDWVNICLVQTNLLQWVVEASLTSWCVC